MSDIPSRFQARIKEAKEKQLQELDLSNTASYINKYNNKINEILFEVFELEHLEILKLSNNYIREIPEEIANLANLTYLDLSDNQLKSVPKAIANLANLTYLYLGGNQLKSVPEAIGNLSNLTYLDLGRNQLKSLPETIGNLANLTSLYLGGKQLTSLPETIGNLANLTSLYLGGNQLTSLPETIGNLANLTSLYLGRNQLTSLPKTIGNLANLTDLDLSDNQLTSLPETMGNLANLTYLYLQNNQLTNLPETIGNLANLTSLYLGRNQLTSLPETIGNLANLTYLYLQYNQLTNLPETIGNLPNLTQFNLEGNPLEEPPLEVCKRGMEAVREYFRKIKEEGFDIVCEAKFIIVGEGEAGKTSLMNKILDPDYLVPQTETATHGIDIKIHNFTVETDKQFRVNIWDFGGQEIYHQTHQFFLTKRSVYALVTDSRKDHQHLDYWLQIVELLSENSPMLIIKNEKDCAVDIKDEGQIRTRFKKMVQEILETNLANNKGLETIVSRVEEYIQYLPHVGIKIPKSWAKVRKIIEKDNHDYISLDQFLEICDDCEYTKSTYFEEKETNDNKGKDGRLILSQFLHDLGIILHFQEDKESVLYDTVILNPTWGTQAVYELLKPEDNLVKKNLGKFTFEHLETIWSDSRYKGKYRELLELMKRFKLCYQIPNYQPKTYIAPQLLDNNNPDYEWNNQDNLQLIYLYQFMPKGILSRFIVEMHCYIEEPKVWLYGVILNGVILTYQNTRAEVIETYNSREIQIKLQGNNKRGLLELIIARFDLINSSYHNLQVDKKIPCNCYSCQQKQKPHFFILEKLRERLQNKKMTIECQNPPYDDVNIYNLIDKTIGRDNFNPSNQGKYNINVNVGDREVQNNPIYQNNSGSGDNVAGSVNHTTNNYNAPVGIGSNSGQIEIKDNAKVAGIVNENKSQNLVESAKEIKALLDELDKEYNNDSVMVGVKAVEKIRNNSTLRSRFVNALKEGGTEAFNQLIDHPACSIVLAAGKGFMDAE